MTVSDVKEYIRARRITTSDISDEELSTLIDDCLIRFSQYRPKVLITTENDIITTVANQPNYSLPTDTLWVIAAFYRPTTLGSEELTIYYPVIEGTTSSSHYRDFAIEHITLAQYEDFRRRTDGSWQAINNEIWLFPTPNASGIEVPVLYASAQTITGLNAIDSNLFKEYVFLEALSIVASADTRAGGWTAGSYKVSEGAGKALLDWAGRRLLQLQSMLSSRGRARVG
jgi:hypothetical protein